MLVVTHARFLPTLKKIVVWLVDEDIQFSHSRVKVILLLRLAVPVAKTRWGFKVLHRKGLQSSPKEQSKEEKGQLESDSSDQ